MRGAHRHQAADLRTAGNLGTVGLHLGGTHGEKPHDGEHHPEQSPGNASGCPERDGDRSILKSTHSPHCNIVNVAWSAEAVRRPCPFLGDHEVEVLIAGHLRGGDVADGADEPQTAGLDERPFATNRARPLRSSPPHCRSWRRRHRRLVGHGNDRRPAVVAIVHGTSSAAARVTGRVTGHTGTPRPATGTASLRMPVPRRTARTDERRQTKSANPSRSRGMTERSPEIS